LDLTIHSVTDLAQHIKISRDFLGQNSTRMGLARWFAKETK